jgi:hypothetical protein
MRAGLTISPGNPLSNLIIHPFPPSSASSPSRSSYAPGGKPSFLRSSSSTGGATSSSIPASYHTETANPVEQKTVYSEERGREGYLEVFIERRAFVDDA